MMQLSSTSRRFFDASEQRNNHSNNTAANSAEDHQEKDWTATVSHTRDTGSVGSEVNHGGNDIEVIEVSRQFTFQ